LLRFLSNYIANYPNTYPTTPTITVFCDNQGILDRINQLPVNQPLQSRPTTANDYDIYIAIHTALHDLAPAIMQFCHVKGHQDQNSCQQLSLPARLNIECDKRAAEYLTIARCLKPKPNPRIPQCYPHLQINGQIIVRDLQSSLRDAAMTPEYREYIRKKFKWKDRDCDNVNWLALKLAMQQFERNDRQQLQKFLHDWLPLRTAPHMAQPASNRMCPVCQQGPEDVWHFLECQHPLRLPAYLQLQKVIQQIHKDRGVDPHMLQLLWQGINSVHQHTQLTISMKPTPQTSNRYTSISNVSAGNNCFMDESHLHGLTMLTIPPTTPPTVPSSTPKL